MKSKLDVPKENPKVGNEEYMNNVKFTALYCRLSRDDERNNESMSIENQKLLLERFASERGFKNTCIYADDGITGVHFDRELFSEYGVRYIAVGDNYDSDNDDGYDISTPIKEMMNEFYARDCSRKIQAVFKARMREGKRVSPSVPYGYYRDPNDKQKLLIDPEPAEVVKRIFQLVMEGHGVNKIANILSDDNVLIPSAYAEIYNPENNHSNGFTNPTRWSSTAVVYILEKQEYMGHTVLGKTICTDFKKKKRRKANPDELMIFRDTHPAIIDEETWHNVQRLRTTKRRPRVNKAPPCHLSGLLYCADCNAKLSFRYAPPRKTGKSYPSDSAYVCSSYRSLHKDCTMHFIAVHVIEELLLTAIKNICGCVKENESAFIEKIREASSVRQSEEVKGYHAKLRKSQRRFTELDGLIKKLYEGNAIGKIPDKHFEKLLADYDEEQSALEKEIAELQHKIDCYESDSLKADKFTDLVRRYTEFTELTTPMLNEFIEKIVVHEAEKIEGKRYQKIEIYFNFIGRYELPQECKVINTSPHTKPAIYKAG